MIDFVNEASLEELSKLLNDEFSLEEYIESTGLIYVDKDTLLSIKDRIMGLEFEKRFWEETLPYIDVNSLNERLLNYLIDKNIADSIWVICLYRTDTCGSLPIKWKKRQ